jgi:uncharacterized LabA/DUF88 family protein
MYSSQQNQNQHSTEFISHIHQPAQRVAIFIDTQNLYHSAKALYGARVNFANVLSDSLAGRQLVRAIAYVISSQEGVELSFFEALNDMGIEIKTKDLQIFVDGSKKGDWDVGIAVDALSIAQKVDTIILVTGDGDFVPLVQCLQSFGVRVEVASFAKSTSARLIESAHEFFDLSSELSRMIFSTRRYIKPTFRKNTFTPHARSTSDNRNFEKVTSAPEKVTKPEMHKKPENTKQALPKPILPKSSEVKTLPKKVKASPKKKEL